MQALAPQSPNPAASEGTGSIGLYIHFPWCLAKCPYCDFLSLAEPDPTNIPDTEYTDAIVRELAARAVLTDGRPVHSVFLVAERRRCGLAAELRACWTLCSRTTA